LGKSFLEKMEIGKSCFGKNHGKLAQLINLALKIIYDHKLLCLTQGDSNQAPIGKNLAQCPSTLETTSGIAPWAMNG
jgi:hypothetical protein